MERASYGNSSALVGIFGASVLYAAFAAVWKRAPSVSAHRPY